MNSKQKGWLLIGPCIFSFAVAMTAPVLQVYFMRLISSEVLAISNMLAVGIAAITNTSITKKGFLEMLHFAWDNPNDKSTQQALQKFREKSIIDARKVGVYVLTNYWSTLEDDLKRIYWLRDNGYSPYVMIYDKDHAPVEIRLLQRWVNNKIIFKSVDKFEDYDRRIG